MLWRMPADTRTAKIGIMFIHFDSSTGGIYGPRGRGWSVRHRQTGCANCANPRHGPPARYRERLGGVAEIAGIAEIPKPGARGTRSDVFNLHDLELLHAGRRAQPDHVAFFGAQQRLGDGRDPAHMAFREVDLVDADDLDRSLLVTRIGAGHGGAEEHLVGPGAPGRVDHLSIGQPLAEIAHAAVDLAQALLAVDVVAVLRAVAVAGRPGHDLHDLGPLLAQERVQLLPQAGEALRGHVVLGADRQPAHVFGQVVVVA